MAIPEEKQIGLGTLLAGALFAALALVGGRGSAVAAEAEDARKKIGVGRGICVVLGLPKATQAGFVTDLAKNGELLVYFQSPDPAEVAAVRRAAEAAGLLGGRVFVDRGDWRSVHLADNLAGAVRVGAAAQGKMARQELLRVLHPGGKAILGEEEIIKPFPKGIDGWSHPYHGPDNNPQSNDQVARAPYLTQFLAEPAFCPQPTVTVGAGSAGKAAAGLVFQGDPSGAVRAVNAADRKLRWKAYTGGSIFFPPCVWQGRVYVGSADGWVYAFEAGTGKRLWRFRVAPVQRWIPVYGNLISTWPVAGGVVVQDGVVYAAAGIAHYDGTHVVALDAVTGKVKWYNDSSGEISAKVKNGISLQGKLYLEGGELRFGGGNVYGVARYALQTGKCLNPPSDTTRAGHRTFFRPYYGRYLRSAKRAGDRR